MEPDLYPLTHRGEAQGERDRQRSAAQMAPPISQLVGPMPTIPQSLPATAPVTHAP